MPIAYVTTEEIKDAMTDSIQSTTTTYDQSLRRNANQASRLIDRLTGRTFWDQYATRYPYSNGGQVLHIDGGDLLAVGTISMSLDGGVSYTDLVSTDYYLRGGPNLLYDATPTYEIEMNLNTSGDYSNFYAGQKAVKVVGNWGWHDDYANAWEDSQDTVEDDPLTAAATTVTVNDADGTDLWGDTDRFQAGMAIRVDDEQMIVRVANSATNELTVMRAQHGTTAAAHTVDTTIYRYRAPEVVRYAVIATAVRTFKRAQQAYQDVGGIIDLGELMYVKELAPEAKVALYDAGLIRVTV